MECFAVELDKYFNFSASHFIVLNNFRERIHGHSYKVSIKVKSFKLNSSHYVIDFGAVKEIMLEIIKGMKEYLLIPRFNEHIAITEEDEEVSISVLHDGTKFSFPKKDVKILDIPQISSECLAKYITQLFLARLKNEFSHTLLETKILKITTKVHENKGKIGYYYWKEEQNQEQGK